MATTATFTIIHGLLDCVEQKDGSDSCPVIEEINARLDEEGAPPLNDLSGQYSGSGVPTHRAWGGCYRRLSWELERELKEFILTRAWLDPDEVVFVLTPDGGGDMEVWRPAKRVSNSTS